MRDQGPSPVGFGASYRLEGIAELAALVTETRAIVRPELPEVDVDVRWRPVP